MKDMKLKQKEVRRHFIFLPAIYFWQLPEKCPLPALTDDFIDSFMIAFKNPVSAVLFCLAVQEALMEAPWPEELLQHPDGCEYRNESSGELVFRGLRVRMVRHSSPSPRHFASTPRLRTADDSLG